MNVLVTGGAGFIGVNLVRHLLRTEHDIRLWNLDALTYAGNLKSLEDVSSDPRYIFVKGDITDVQRVQEVFEQARPEVVVHLAAESHVDRSIHDAGVFVKTNVLGTLMLLEASKRVGVKRFCHVSTDEVYGSLGPDDPPFTEDNPIVPNSPYSASKAGADLLVRSYVQTHGFPAVITRCSNNYGPFQFPEKFIPLLTTNALDDKELPVYGDGLNIRDWIHVSDHCSGIWAAVKKGRVGEVYNFGCDNEWKNIDIVHRLLELTWRPKSLIRFVQDRPGHDRRYAMGAEKARRELGWAPALDFKTGLSETVAWYADNRTWWEDIKSGKYRNE